MQENKIQENKNKIEKKVKIVPDIAPEDIILNPVLTEKSYKLSENKKFVFICRLDATKPQIKRAVEKIFGVKVKKVNTMIYKGKVKRRGIFVGRRPSFKKAIVSIEGQLDIGKITEKFTLPSNK
jgi:LSU ribosomal protein L23P